MGVILKRMILRAAEAIAKRMNINGLVTGESIAQVSSQTLMNLAVIDSVTETMVLRPLCTSDKQEIIDIAREIGAEDFSKNIPEYCAVISKNPTTKAKLEKIENEENRFDFEKLQAAIDSARYQLITEVVDDFNNSSSEVAIEKEVSNGSIVIDIRHPDDLEITPLQIAGVEVLNIPFYQLRTNFSSLNKDAHYLLYCDKGMMSRLHAAHLQDEGFSNIGVLDLRSSS